MAQPRQSTFGNTTEQEKYVNAAKALNDTLETSNLQLLHNVTEFNTHRLDSEETSDTEEVEFKDPAIVTADVAEQIVSFSAS